ncbi:integrase catalytic domain-containing protein [Nephila pilipes]|uniref:Integrase catalytic domain-containing protein n=2 Tax=Nephila pilipes TaxID=299642 RepID=A0A8X6QBP5_NEPPI|nr:integrase catalytic domain-containing protein [Nephila pilipes]
MNDDNCLKQLKDLEKKKIIVSSLNKENDKFYNDISSYKRIIRVTSWIYRFYENTKTCNKKTGELSKEELKKAELKILKKVQEDSFQGEKVQRLKSLPTFIDADGILRIKTKLLMREDDENFKVPIVLPSDHHVVKSLILSKHQDLGHPGLQSLMIPKLEYYTNDSAKEVYNVLREIYFHHIIEDGEQYWSWMKPYFSSGGRYEA